MLCKSLEGVQYFDCELPSVRREMEDPEGFLRAFRGRSLALDEIHRLDDPALLLKIAADHFPDIRIICDRLLDTGNLSKIQGYPGRVQGRASVHTAL